MYIVDRRRAEFFGQSNFATYPPYALTDNEKAVMRAHCGFALARWRANMAIKC
jgi:hypothetical protein